MAEALALHSIEMREHVEKKLKVERAHTAKEIARLSDENAALRADLTIMRTINANRSVLGVVRKEANRDVA